MSRLLRIPVLVLSVTLAGFGLTSRANSLLVSARGGTAQTSALVEGQGYLLVASGTYAYRTNGESADAAFLSVQRTPPPYSPTLFINNAPPDWLGSQDGIEWQPKTFSPSHDYRLYVLGQGSSLGLRIYDSQYTDNSGSLTVTWTAGTMVTVPAGVEMRGQAGFGDIAGELPFSKAGDGTFVLDTKNALNAPAFVSGGTLELADPQSLFASTVFVTANGRLRVREETVTQIAGLSLSDNGLVDLTTGSLTVGRGLSSDRVTAELLKGRGDGSWNGASGITSSTASADVTNGIVRSVGWKINPDDSITIAYAAPGDTNLDGEVNVFDLVNVNGSGTYGKGNASNWSQGDFDYNGVTNIFDMVQTNGAGVYGRGNYLPATPPSVNAVPEPASLLLAFTGLAGSYYMLRRRGA